MLKGELSNFFIGWVPPPIPTLMPLRRSFWFLRDWSFSGRGHANPTMGRLNPHEEWLQPRYTAIATGDRKFGRKSPNRAIPFTCGKPGKPNPASSPVIKWDDLPVYASMNESSTSWWIGHLNKNPGRRLGGESSELQIWKWKGAPEPPQPQPFAKKICCLTQIAWEVDHLDPVRCSNSKQIMEAIYRMVPPSHKLVCN